MAHATALRLHDAGADDALIAKALGIEAEGVAALLALAEAKLDRALGLDPSRDGANEGQAPA